MLSVAVVGAGIVGMSTAYRLQTELNAQVTVIAEKFSPDLTSDGAAGLWDPYDLAGTDPVRGTRWSADTYNHLLKLALSPESIRSGTSTISYVHLSTSEEAVPPYRESVLHFNHLTTEDLTDHPDYIDGFQFTSIICEPRHYLPWLSERFLQSGGRIESRKVNHLSELCGGGYDLVVNCTGLGAREVVNDDTMFPIKGQVIKVKPRQSINTALTLFNKNKTIVGIMPGRDVVTLGVTYEKNVDNCDVDRDTKRRIWENCCQVEPSLRDAEVIYDWCGLRPARRGGTRLEIDESIHPHTKIIHNYGHSGIGITLHWGCAGDVVELMRQLFPYSSVKSKL